MYGITFAGLQALEPRKLGIVLIPTIAKPSTPTRATTAYAVFLESAALGARWSGVGVSTFARAGLRALKPRVVESFVASLPAVLEPSATTSATCAYAGLRIPNALGARA